MSPLARLAVCALISGSASARADSIRVAILPGVVPSSDGSAAIEDSRVIATVRRIIDSTPGLIAPAREELSSRTVEELHDCGSRVSCLAPQLRAHGFALAVTVAVDESSQPPLISVWVVRADRDEPVAKELREATANLAAIESAIAEAATRALARAGHPLGARVTIETSPPEATVFLDGAPMIERAGVLVASGARRFSAIAEDHVETSSVAVLAPGTTARLRLELQPDEGSTHWWLLGAGILVVGAGIGAAVMFAPSPPFMICQPNQAGGGCSP